MRDDAQFLAWLEIQRQIFALMAERRTATTAQQVAAYNAAIDALKAQAAPLWTWLSVRYPPYELDRAAEEVR